MKSKRYIINAGIIVLVVIAVVAGILFYTKSQGTVTNYFLSGGSKGRGVSIFVPKEMKADQDSSKNVKFFEENYPGTKDTKSTLVITSSTVADSVNTANQTDQAIKSPSSASFLKLSSTQGTFIENAAATGSPAVIWPDNAQHNQFNLGKPVKFTNKHIKSNAWRFNFTLTHPASGKLQAVKVDGYLIYGFGKTSSFRVLVSSADDNWRAGTATWQKIADSLQINQ